MKRSVGMGSPVSVGEKSPVSAYGVEKGMCAYAKETAKTSMKHG